MELCSPAHDNISAITEDVSEMIRLIIRISFISPPFFIVILLLT